MKWGVASALATAAFAFAGMGLASSSFSDESGDNNEAPDLTSVTVSEPATGMLSVSVAVDNFETLPTSSWINLWFDLDSNVTTGDAGDEALVRYSAEGKLEFFRWNGTELALRPSDGMTATFAASTLTFTAAKSAFDDASAFGILAVASRGQEVEANEYTAADFAPDSGRSSYVGPGPVAFADPNGDHPAAPDVRSVRVTDAKAGMISFAVTTPNFQTLPPEMLVLLLVDRDRKQSTGAGGADIMVLYQAGEVQIGRWDKVQQQFLADEASSRVLARNADGVLTFLVHRSVLGDPARFGFAIGAGHLDADGVFDALDIAPEKLFWQYRMVNKPALRLIAGKASGAPARPVAGKVFTITLPVSRSDTGRQITTGSVACNVRVAGQRVVAAGKVAAGKGRCSFRVPQAASRKRVSGSMVVHSGGKTVTAQFAFIVR